MASFDYPALRPKKLWWADHMEEQDALVTLATRDSLTLEDVSKLLHLALSKCEVDTTQTAHHYQIDDAFVDIMYRDHVVISYSKVKPGSSEGDDNDDEDDEEEEEEYKDEDRDKPDKPNHSTATAEEVPVEFADAAAGQTVETKEVPDKVQWKKVETKKSRQLRAASQILSQHSKTFYAFANEANDSYMDFVAQVTGVDQLFELAKQHSWLHGYCIEDNMVYDFNDCFRRGKYRFFIPNTAYLHKFEEWLALYEKFGKTLPPDERVFRVFRENSTWPTWTTIGVFTGLPAVRKVLQNSKSEFGHAYCVDTSDLLNFWFRDGHFYQRWTKAPEKYVERFEAFQEGEKPQAAV